MHYNVKGRERRDPHNDNFYDVEVERGLPKETNKEIKRLKDKLNDDGFIACDLFTGEILNDKY